MDRGVLPRQAVELPPLGILPRAGARGLVHPDDAARDGVQDGDPHAEREATPQLCGVEIGSRVGPRFLAPVKEMADAWRQATG